MVKRSGLDIDFSVDNTTFEQFATYLVLQWKEGGSFQIHWREQYKLCHPCQVQFDVGHYETLQDDAQFVLRKTKLDDKVLFPEWQPTNTSASMKNYYSTLSLLRIRQRMLLKRGMGNGEWEIENGKWEIENGKWEIENGKWEIENGKLNCLH